MHALVVFWTRPVDMRTHTLVRYTCATFTSSPSHNHAWIQTAPHWVALVQWLPFPFLGRKGKRRDISFLLLMQSSLERSFNSLSKCQVTHDNHATWLCCLYCLRVQRKSSLLQLFANGSAQDHCYPQSWISSSRKLLSDLRPLKAPPLPSYTVADPSGLQDILTLCNFQQEMLEAGIQGANYKIPELTSRPTGPKSWMFNCCSCDLLRNASRRRILTSGCEFSF